MELFLFVELFISWKVDSDVNVHLMNEWCRVIDICGKFSELCTTLHICNWRASVDFISIRKTWPDCVFVLDKYIQYYVLCMLPLSSLKVTVSQNPMSSFLDSLLSLLALTLTTQPWIETWQIVIKLDSAFPFNCFNLLSKLLFKIVLCFKFHLFDWLEIILRRIFLIYYLVPDIVLEQSESDIKIYVKLQFYAPYPYVKVEILITNEVFGQPFLKMSRFETIFRSL